MGWDRRKGITKGGIRIAAYSARTHSQGEDVMRSFRAETKKGEKHQRLQLSPLFCNSCAPHPSASAPHTHQVGNPTATALALPSSPAPPTCRAENLGIEHEDVRNGQEGGQPGPQLDGDRAATLRDAEVPGCRGEARGRGILLGVTQGTYDDISQDTDQRLMPLSLLEIRRAPSAMHVSLYG